ncbi:MAG: regulatory iron-sulfur-containing complex subunit RicT [Ruthenibacterium lactatiformans]
MDMKLDVEYTLDRNKILFYLRPTDVDSVTLSRTAGVFRTRIELRQIGVQESKCWAAGCGQPFCCSRFCGISSRCHQIAQERGLSLNPAKISGSCGRLMCCLAYEQPAYV